MHYLVYVLLPKDTTDVHKTIAALMEPHRETYNEQTGTSAGWWDWYQLGGRWTGHFDGYDPDKDPANYSTCEYCRGTGTRKDMLTLFTGGTALYPCKPGATGCNACGGSGMMYAWPTEWKERPEDIAPASSVKDTPAVLVLADGTAIQRKTWNGEDFIETPDYESKARAAIEAHDGLIAIVDCHN